MVLLVVLLVVMALMLTVVELVVVAQMVTTVALVILVTLMVIFSDVLPARRWMEWHMQQIFSIPNPPPFFFFLCTSSNDAYSVVGKVRVPLEVVVMVCCC